MRTMKKGSAASRTLPLYPDPKDQPAPPKEKAAKRPVKAKPSYEGNLVRGGLVETTALKTYAATGRWPDFFLSLCGGVVPERLVRRGEELRRARV